MQTLDNVPEDIQILFVEYITKSISYTDSVKLQHWIESDINNKEIFSQFKISWLVASNVEKEPKLDVPLHWDVIENDIKLLESPSLSIKYSKNKILRSLRVAASWLLLISIGFILNHWLNKAPFVSDSRMVEYTVPKGSKSQIKLPDGTIVWLNAGSVLKYDNSFDLKERNVFLTGEAYFSVATNKNKPFQVHTSDLLVRAFGTKFNVKAYPDEKTITTTLEEGIIDVMVINLKEEKPNKPVKLKPNEKVVYFREGRPEKPREESFIPKHKKQLISNKLKLEENINTNLYTSWKNNEWTIEGQSLKCLIPILERKYNMTFHFENEELMNYRFTGIIQNETVEQFLKLLSYTAPLNYTITKDTISLTINHKLQSQFKRIITTRN